MNYPLPDHRQFQNNRGRESTSGQPDAAHHASDHGTSQSASSPLIPAFQAPWELTVLDFRRRFTEARDAWLARSPSRDTRANYARDLSQFLRFCGIEAMHLEALATVRPAQVAAWRDSLREQGLRNSSILRKMTALRSLFSYLQTYGYSGANPAHSDFVESPSVPRDGKTIGLSPEDCRRLLDAPNPAIPAGVRDRALLAVLAYSACRVGEVAKLKVGDYKLNAGHKILEVYGKGGKERRVPLHPEAFERIEIWLDVAGLRDAPNGPLFPPARSARADGRDGFRDDPLTRRAIQLLIKRYARRLHLDPAVTVHSLRVTALTTARERGADIIDLQDFAGHRDPRVTLSYIRTRDRLSKSPAYVLKY